MPSFVVTFRIEGGNRIGADAWLLGPFATLELAGQAQEAVRSLLTVPHIGERRAGACYSSTIDPVLDASKIVPADLAAALAQDATSRNAPKAPPRKPAVEKTTADLLSKYPTDVAARKAAAAFFNLTQLEAEILCHRLYVPDCICESLADSEGEDATLGHEADEAAALMEAGKYDEAFRAWPVAAAAVLANAVEASTFFACCDGNESRATCRKVSLAGHSLAAKIAKRIGREVYFPG